MNKEIKKARAAAFGGGSVSDAPNAASCADMAPPLSNRGGAETGAALSTEQETFEKYTTFLTDSKGRLIEVPLRRGKANSAFIDQISFSVHEDTFAKPHKPPIKN
ncbi:replication initiation factor domain protein [Neisseria weixii]|uniref:Replication initiation factor domain protein n=2 Tax=Neisseria weixii TaxID=1853276 RepID=A0A3N4MWU3_9NEIS|nr:replication initiation factor domain protein [Neisseria weixii]RPD87240.1 replication initiation factor domain protein [Neisseria weixii]